MTHRLEAAAAAASKDLYDDPETGGTLDRRRQERGPRNESRREGESIPLNNLGNSTKVDEGLYSTPDEIPGSGAFATAINDLKSGMAKKLKKLKLATLCSSIIGLIAILLLAAYVIYKEEVVWFRKTVNVAEEKVIIIVGGFGNQGNTSEAILFGDETCPLPSLPVKLTSPAVLMTEGSKRQEIMACGGTSGKACYALKKDKWVEQGEFSESLGTDQLDPAVAAMSTGKFVFGSTTSQIMKKGSKQWVAGPEPHPNGTFHYSCVAKISEEELLVMGGYPGGKYGKQVFKYNVQDKSWTKMDDLKTARRHHSCAMFQDGPSSYVLVAGGHDGSAYLSSTEIYYFNGTSVEGKPMNKARAWFSLKFIDTPKPRLYAIGGSTGSEYLNDVEFWDSSQTWTYTSRKMTSKKDNIGSLVVPKSMLSDYCEPKN